MLGFEPIPDQTSWSRGHLTGKPIHYPKYLGETFILVRAACIFPEAWRAPRGPMLDWEPPPDHTRWGRGHSTRMTIHHQKILGEISILVRAACIFPEAWRAQRGPCLFERQFQTRQAGVADMWLANQLNTPWFGQFFALQLYVWALNYVHISSYFPHI